MKDYIKSMYEQWVWISRMINRVEKKFWEKLWKERVKDIIEQLKEEWVRSRSAYTSKDLEREDGWLKNLVQSVSEKPYDYIAETWHIILKMDDMQYPILVSTIDAMIESYSKHWENLSWQQIQYKFSLTPRVWNFIKNAFNIYKDSIPFSIITLLDIPEDQLQSVAKEKADQLLESKMSKIYIDTVNRLKEKKFKDFAKASMWYTVFLEQLDELIDKYKRTELIKKQPKIKNDNSLVCFLTDAHLGKNWTQWIINRFNTICEELLNKEEKNITIVFGGDIGELFVPYGEMHPWQKLWMENITTTELVMLCVDVLENMISKLYNAGKKIQFKTVLGNHCFLKKENPEFLTEQWYMDFDYIVENNLKLAQLNSKWSLVYDYPKWIIKESRIGKFCRFNTTWRMNKWFTVTDKHLFIVDWNKIEADKLDVINYSDTPVINWKYSFDKIDKLALLTILDWSVVYANDNSKKEYRFRRLQFKVSKPEKIKYIENMLNELWVEHTIKKATMSWWNKLQPYLIRIYWDDARAVNKLIWKDKAIPNIWYNVDNNSKQEILDIIANTDWTLREWKLRIYNTDKLLLDWIDTIFCVSIYKNKRRWFDSPNKKQLYEWSFLDNYKLIREDYLWEEDIVDFEMPEWNLFVRVWNTTFNHSNCRMSEVKEYDPHKTWWRIIFSFLQKIFKDKVDIEIFNDDYNSFYCWGVKYLVMHWDWLSTTKLNRLALQEVENWKYLCIISWDKHHLMFKEVSDKVMWIQAPALAGAGRYDKWLALSSIPWYLEMKENSEWLLDINIKRLI